MYIFGSFDLYQSRRIFSPWVNCTFSYASVDTLKTRSTLLHRWRVCMWRVYDIRLNLSVYLCNHIILVTGCQRRIRNIFYNVLVISFPFPRHKRMFVSLFFYHMWLQTNINWTCVRIRANVLSYTHSPRII